MISVILTILFIQAASSCDNFDFGTGDRGPANWASFCSACGEDNQSPINIMNCHVDYDTALPELTFSNFRETPTTERVYKQDGSVFVEIASAGYEQTVRGGGLTATYNLATMSIAVGCDNTQGSHHQIESSRSPMELEMLLYDNQYPDLTAAIAADGLLVLSVLFETTDQDNAAYAPMIDAIASLETADDDTFDGPLPIAYLPLDRENFYKYTGTLSVPGCNTAERIVFKQKIKISNSQLNKVRSAKDAESNALVNNYRPIQGTSDGRNVLGRNAECQTEGENTFGFCQCSSSIGQDILNFFAGWFS